MRFLLERQVGIEFVTYMHPIMNQLKHLNLFPSVTVKSAAVTGNNWLAVLREHAAAGKTSKGWEKEASATLLLHQGHP